MTLARRPAAVALLKVEEAANALALCRTTDEAKSIRDKAIAIEAYLRSQKAGGMAQADAAEIKLRAERRLGELLEEQAESRARQTRGGDRKSKSPEATLIVPTLRKLGISRTQSSDWQRVAAVPREKFEAHVQAVRTKGERITTAPIIREAKREEKHAAIAKQSKDATPIGLVQPCPIVYADPPWQYGNTSCAVAAEDQYPTMPLADICALEIPATKDAVLFLWATSPLLPEALKVIEAWGFSYKGSMVWDKGMGTGNWVLNCHELLLIAVRGDFPCPAPENRPKSVVRARRGRHSAKPEEFAHLIELMFPGLPRVEMFARHAREGWLIWGNEAA